MQVLFTFSDLCNAFAAPNNNVAIGVTTDMIGTGTERIGRE